MGKRNVILLMLLLLTIIPSITAYELCTETVSEDELEILEITDLAQTSETSWIWKSAEQITIEVQVRNKNFTKRDFQLELFFLDEDLTEKNIVTINANRVKTISLDKDKTETLNFSFQLNEPSDDIYYLYAKLHDENNESICTSLKATSTNKEATITIEKLEKIIVVRNINGPTNTTSGSNVEYIVEIINLGDAKEDRISVIMYNAELKIREAQEIIGLNVEESKTVTFNFTIPKNATGKIDFLFSTEYDYNNETNNYYQSSDKSKTFSTQIIIAQNQTIQVNQTQNQTTQINQTQNQTEAIPQEAEPEKTPIPYLWPIIITFLLIITIIIATLFLLKYKKDQYIKSPSKPSDTQSSTAADTYVAKIQEKPKPTSKLPTSPNPPSKPSETNTANTKTPPTSQNRPQ